MSPTIEILGVYPVEANEPVHLVEIKLTGVTVEQIDFVEFTQEIDGSPRESWQVPWDEKMLATDGTSITWDSAVDFGSQPTLGDEVRLLFFLHYLQPAKTLITPFGEIPLPQESVRPTRLAFINYEAP